MNKIKVFISQPMKDRSNEEIEAERAEVKKKLDEKFGEGNYEIIDSFFKDAPHNEKPLYYLGKSLQLLSQADICVFVNQWYVGRGCVMEHRACEEYHITIWEI